MLCPGLDHCCVSWTESVRASCSWIQLGHLEVVMGGGAANVMFPRFFFTGGGACSLPKFLADPFSIGSKPIFGPKHDFAGFSRWIRFAHFRTAPISTCAVVCIILRMFCGFSRALQNLAEISPASISFHPNIHERLSDFWQNSPILPEAPND